MSYPIAEIINLIAPNSQRLWSASEDDAREYVRRGDTDAVRGLDGSFALVAQDGQRVMLARSLDRPLRYFLAKAAAGPVLIVAERIDEIRRELARHGWSAQFHPSYTRMVPAHHVTTLRLVGCPDPNPGPHSILRSAARDASAGSRRDRPPLRRGAVRGASSLARSRRMPRRPSAFRSPAVSTADRCCSA